MPSVCGQRHGLLGWMLFALIAGHITTALIHPAAFEQPMINRMTRSGER